MQNTIDANNEKSIEIINFYTKELLMGNDLFIFISNKIISDLMCRILMGAHDKATECDRGLDLMHKVFIPAINAHAEEINDAHKACIKTQENIVKDSTPKPKNQESTSEEIASLVSGARDLIEYLFSNCHNYIEGTMCASLGVVASFMGDTIKASKNTEMNAMEVFLLVKKSLEDAVKIIDVKIKQHLGEEQLH